MLVPLPRSDAVDVDRLRAVRAVGAVNKGNMYPFTGCQCRAARRITAVKPMNGCPLRIDVFQAPAIDRRVGAQYGVVAAEISAVDPRRNGEACFDQTEVAGRRDQRHVIIAVEAQPWLPTLAGLCPDTRPYWNRWLMR